MKQNLPKSAWPKVRKFLTDVHLWLGLGSGLIVLAICFSGTIYVYNTEIRELAQPELYRVESDAGAAKLSPEDIITRVSNETGGKVISIKIPSDPERSYVLSVRKEEEEGKGEKKEGAGKGERERFDKKEGGNGVKKGEGQDKSAAGAAAPAAPPRTQYFVNPYTGEILGNSQDKTAVSVFMGYLFSLHRWLLLDKIKEPLFGELPNKTLGSYISGTATILFTLGVITGFVIWFPHRVSNWKQGLKVKWNANWKRVNHDLHNSLGFYSCIFLFMMGITGPQWSFPWYREALRKTLGTYQPADAPKPEAPKSAMQPGLSLKPLSISDYIKAADQSLKYKGDNLVTLAADSSEAIAVSKTRTGFFAPVAADKLFLDQYSGKVLQTDIFREKPINERISNSIKAIHVGDVYGSFTKLLYFLACLVATSLPITGTMIWLNKLKKR
ncbi:PepSY-associated TM helix domain-containing protein [Daejeonella sp.]|uniref:PepSY-associated TM helix domain-containing protein n=1 Tax=Daejeonella sp. TaxID=2805397 RepID=UPI0030BFC0A8